MRCHCGYHSATSPCAVCASGTPVTVLAGVYPTLARGGVPQTGA